MTNGKDHLRIAWLFPAMVRASYWHPILSEFTKVFKETTVYTGLWSGFTPGFEGTFTVEVVGKTVLTESTQPLPRYSRGVAYASLSIVIYLLKLKPQIIFTSAFSIWSLLAILFKPWGGWRIIIAWDGSSPTVDACDSKLRIILRRQMVRFADALITNNNRGKAYLIEILKTKESQIFVRPYQVPDAKALSEQQENIEGSDQDWRHPVFLFVGQLIQRKGVHLLLESCAILQKSGYHDYIVIIVGDGPQRDEFEDFSQSQGLQNCIKWVGWVEYDRLSTYFRSADVFVFPTLEDIWGVVVLEALAFGKPVLCSQWAGAAEMVAEGENGHVFDPHDPESLAKIMRRFIDEPNMSVVMGRKSQQMMSQHTPEAVAQFLGEVVHFALKNQ